MKAYDELKAAVLAKLVEGSGGWDCIYGRWVAEELGIPRDVCLAILRELRNEGEVVYVRGLFSDYDGMTAGSGYMINLRAPSRIA